MRKTAVTGLPPVDILSRFAPSNGQSGLIDGQLNLAVLECFPNPTCHFGCRAPPLNHMLHKFEQSIIDRSLYVNKHLHRQFSSRYALSILVTNPLWQSCLNRSTGTVSILFLMHVSL